MIEFLLGDCRDVLPGIEEGIVNCCVTSPPYWALRDYGADKQLGLESTPEEYVDNMVHVFREVKRVLRKDGTLWLNLGDCYAGGGNNRGNRSPLSQKQASNRGAHGMENHIKNTMNKWEHPYLKRKDLVGIPWRVAFALQQDGWYLRSDIIWSKPNAFPESVTDRPTKAHEYVFLFSKSPDYYYDHETVKEDAITRPQNRFTERGSHPKGYGQTGVKPPEYIRWPGIGKKHAQIRNRDEKQSHMVAYAKRNLRSVWHIPTKPYPGAHFATMPPKLAERCILAGSPREGIVLDPFTGAGTTAMVAQAHGRRFIGCEINPAYIELAKSRTDMGLFDSGAA